jgi:hypothetical protein
MAFMEKERLKDAKHDMNMRYASLPKRSDPHHQAYLRQLYGEGIYQKEPRVVNHTNEVHHHHFEGAH